MYSLWTLITTELYIVQYIYIHIVEVEQWGFVYSLCLLRSRSAAGQGCGQGQGGVQGGPEGAAARGGEHRLAPGGGGVAWQAQGLEEGPRHGAGDRGATRHRQHGEQGPHQYSNCCVVVCVQQGRKIPFRGAGRSDFLPHSFCKWTRLYLPPGCDQSSTPLKQSTITFDLV